MMAIGVYARMMKHAGKYQLLTVLIMFLFLLFCSNPHEFINTLNSSIKILSETALACLSVDPALMLLVVGILMFVITFCGCVGSLRENICLLQTVS